MQIQSDSMKILVFSDANFYKIVRAAQEPCHAPWWFKCQILKKNKNASGVSKHRSHNLLCNLVAAYVLAMLILKSTHYFYSRKISSIERPIDYGT